MGCNAVSRVCGPGVAPAPPGGTKGPNRRKESGEEWLWRRMVSCNGELRSLLICETPARSFKAFLRTIKLLKTFVWMKLYLKKAEQQERWQLI